ncbi:MAG: sigma-54 dependent transcriptional regulator [Deltaproteobacteria bacterium]
MKKIDILVVEDGKSQRKMLKEFLAKEGHLVADAEDGQSAIAIATAQHFDLVFLDYKMPGMNGMEVLKTIKAINSEIDVVITTAYGTIETAVEAMKAGALDYLTKPIDFEELLLLIARIAERQTLIKENEMLRRDLEAKNISSDKIIYQSQKIGEIVNLVGRVASSKATVLISGESGTGKELFARLTHNLSPRASKPLVCVNCSALPEALLESELFGHERGSFTGAQARRIGRFEQADGGTLFLDEIGDITPSTQVKLLRFLQEREFQRIGSNQNISADIRIISATNRDLLARVKDGSFREDLFFRLNVVVITVPPLRDRKDDIQPLLTYFINHYAQENGKHINGITAEARGMLMKYDFQGNVRELENIVERAIVIARNDSITVQDLPFGNDNQFASEAKTVMGTIGTDMSMRKALEAMEKQMIVDTMQKTNGHQTRCAEMLGISERMLRYKLKKYKFKE